MSCRKKWWTKKKYLKKLRWMTKKRDVLRPNTQQLGKNDVRKRLKKMTTHAKYIVHPKKKMATKKWWSAQPHKKITWKPQHRPKKRIPKKWRKKKQKKIWTGKKLIHFQWSNKTLTNFFSFQHSQKNECVFYFFLMNVNKYCLRIFRKKKQRK